MSDLNSDLAALRIERAPERAARRSWIIWVIVLLLLLGGGAGAYWWFTREQPVEVQTAEVSVRAAGTQAAVLNASGYVTARRRATVSSKITGKVVEVNVEEGMRVQAGQVLARLDDAESQAALALAQAQFAAADRAVKENDVHLAQARINLRRADQLLKAGAGTQVDVDQAQLDVDSTEARVGALREQTKVAERQVELQKTNLDNTVIRAPFTGIAVTKDAQPGEMVSPVSAGGGFTRTGICTVVDMQSLEVDVDVNESYIGRVKPGQDVSAALDAYPDWQIPARVITVVPTADRQKATVMVRIAFKQLDPRILPDMGVKVTFLAPPEEKATVSAQPTALVPKAAVLTQSGQTFVFVVHGDKADRQAVRVGGADGERVEVVGGLQGGERVVLSPPADLKDGARVVLKSS